MSENPALHKRLVARQPDEELERKAKKAYRPAIWTQEDMDAAERRAQRICEKLKIDDDAER
jgi:hypothetical protein